MIHAFTVNGVGASTNDDDLTMTRKTSVVAMAVVGNQLAARGEGDEVIAEGRQGVTRGKEATAN